MREQKWLRPARIIISILFLAGFCFIFSDVKAKLPSGITLFFTFFQFLPSVLKFPHQPGIIASGFFLIILLTVFSGRVYCSTFCPMGILMDVLGFIKRKLPIRKKRRKFRKPLNFFRYILLSVAVLSLFITGIFTISWLDPYANFGRIASNLYQPVFIFLNNVVSKLLIHFNVYSIQPLAFNMFHPLPFFAALSILFTIMVMVFFRDRLYCNTICPVGAILGLISKASLLKIKIDSSSCTQCGKCQTSCKANCINIKEMHVDETRCISCFNCIQVCEESSIGYKKSRGMKNETINKTDQRKRDFIKAGILFMGINPLLAKGEEHHNEVSQDRPRFCTRGPISPPGSRSIKHLKSNCIACQLCISVCPSRVLQPAFLEYGFTGMMMPRLDNQAGFCNYDCTKCGEVCPTGAIIPLTKEAKKTTQIGTVQFRQHLCIVESEGTACGSCSEHCPTQAVYMVPYKDDLTIPEVNTDICVGCGACEHACPVTDPHAAIFVYPHEQHQTALKPETEKVKMESTEEFPF
jgi:ferredoxin